MEFGTFMMLVGGGLQILGGNQAAKNARKQAQAAQQNMLNTGFQQLAQYFAAQDANRLGADYAGMYSDTYDYTWEPFMEGLFSKKDKKDKKNKK